MSEGVALAGFNADQPTPSAVRSALAIGMVGALGEELLAALVGSTNYRTVHVAVEHPIGSATARFQPWVIGDGDVVADDAYICMTGPEAFVPKASPMQRVDADTVVAAAQTARSCRVSRLVIVSPLSALLQLNAASHTLSGMSEMEIAAMGFESLIVVRPTADQSTPSSGWFSGLARSATRAVLEIMLPPQVQALRARTAALAIVEAVRRSQRAVRVLGARELHAIVAETMPQVLPRRLRLR